LFELSFGLVCLSCDTPQDQEIDDIDKGVDQLGELARMARDEVKLQSTMLDTIEEKMDDVHERVVTLNTKMKKTLEEVGVYCLEFSFLI
jgi:t-SNARE complex subunit (syntaxin)